MSKHNKQPNPSGKEGNQSGSPKKQSTVPNNKGVQDSKNRGAGSSRPNDQSRNRKPGRTNGQSSGQGSNPFTSGYDAVKSNDISWWNNSPMYADAVRVPFNRIYGDPIRNLGVSFLNRAGVTEEDWYRVEGLAEEAAFPGIMKIYFQPTIGTTIGEGDAPVNRAFINMFDVIFSHTAGDPGVIPPDFALFMTSSASIPMLIALVKRILGVSQLYAGRNYYYPRRLLEALGVDPTTVIGKQDNIRMKLNDSILSFNNLKIPDFMPIYKRWYSLAHNIYADEDDIQSQLFFFQPEYFYQYVDHGDEGISEHAYLKPVFLPVGEGDLGLVSVDAYLDLIDDLLAAWRNTSDLGLISGNIQRYFSDNALLTLEFVQDGETVVPVPDRNMTWQINNLTTLRLNPNSLYVTQNVVKNIIKFEPTLYQYDLADPELFESYMHFRNQTLLTSFDGQTDDEFIMEATRLIAIPGNPLSESTESKVGYMNTEVVSRFHTYNVTYDQLTRTMVPRISEFQSYVCIDWNNIVDPENPSVSVGWHNVIMRNLSELAKFKHGPRVWMLNPPEDRDENSDVEFGVGHVTGDVYKYTTVDRQALVSLNEVALQSIYSTNFANVK